MGSVGSAFVDFRGINDAPCVELALGNSRAEDRAARSCKKKSSNRYLSSARSWRRDSYILVAVTIRG